jgi:tripartite-type tricarboxylate transporter receptor subunit TctC
MMVANPTHSPEVSAPRRRAVLAAAMGALLARPALATTGYPNRPARMIVPFAPGGAIDLAGRTMASALGNVLGQPFVVENRAGAGGLIGFNMVVRAAPDGYTLGVGSGGPLTIAPTLYRNANFDPLTQLTPIILTSTTPIVLVGRKGLPAANLAELVALSRARPEGLTAAAASPGGSLPQLAGEYLQQRLGVRWLSVPTRGSPGALADLLAERVDLLVDAVPAPAALVANGQLKAYAVTTTERSLQLPGVPTMQELGYADFNVGSWAALVGPANMPPEIVAVLNTTLTRELRSEETRQKLAAVGAQVEGGDPARVTRLIEAELPRWRRIIQDSGITPETL